MSSPISKHDLEVIQNNFFHQMQSGNLFKDYDTEMQAKIEAVDAAVAAYVNAPGRELSVKDKAIIKEKVSGAWTNARSLLPSKQRVQKTAYIELEQSNQQGVSAETGGTTKQEAEVHRNPFEKVLNDAQQQQDTPRELLVKAVARDMFGIDPNDSVALANASQGITALIILQLSPKELETLSEPTPSLGTLVNEFGNDFVIAKLQAVQQAESTRAKHQQYVDTIANSYNNLVDSIKNLEIPSYLSKQGQQTLDSFISANKKISPNPTKIMIRLKYEHLGSLKLENLQQLADELKKLQQHAAIIPKDQIGEQKRLIETLKKTYNMTEQDIVAGINAHTSEPIVLALEADSDLLFAMWTQKIYELELHKRGFTVSV